jgi:hypothetical protein
MTGIISQLMLGVSLIFLAWAVPDRMPQRRTGAWKRPPRILGSMLRRGGGTVELIPLVTQLWGWAATASATIFIVAQTSSRTSALSFGIVDGIGFASLLGAAMITWIADRRL